jgi:hypothetical protein
VSRGTCPRCDRPAFFRYASAEAEQRRAPLCWGESESSCPGFGAYAKEVAADRPRYMSDTEFAVAVRVCGTSRGEP